ncbi:hypothetical protein BAE44_0025427 [Dichanthelium oligosanthes]|uniref:Uncharacterized protein n=1 Tax=Dichanthelium oligosanthes TaxID=888268 RepID=A0A1E5UL70_9POAL|nr:hypothetical protein BAE44_0025427 [Dichanthelium oligosanthes]
MSRFVPTGPFRASGVDLGYCRALDSRHGHVLLNRVTDRFGPFEDVLLVWNPITSKVPELPKLPRYPSKSWSAAVLCAAAAGACDHRVCNRGPFCVVFASTDELGIFFCVYSSETRAWSEPASYVNPHPDDYLGSCWGMHSTSISHSATESSGMTWVGPVREARWVQRMVIKLKMLRPADADHVVSPCLIGNIDGAIFFTWLIEGGAVFAADLKSDKVVELKKLRIGDMGVFAIVPYRSYCTPVLKISSKGGGAGPSGSA